jgi:hypothetical protein
MAQTGCGALPPDAKMLKLKLSICGHFEIQGYRSATDQDSSVDTQQEAIAGGVLRERRMGPIE